MDHFVFLFPDKRHVYADNALAHMDTCGILEYFQQFNECIQKRYSDKNFQINHVLMRGDRICDKIYRRKDDSILFADISYNDMLTFYKTNKNYHIDTKNILSQLSGNIDRLVVGGYLLSDCVEKFAEDSFDLGLDVLVDEDLTDLFSRFRKSRNFKTNDYPTFNLASLGYYAINDYLEYRKDKPWLWQTFF